MGHPHAIVGIRPAIPPVVHFGHAVKKLPHRFDVPPAIQHTVWLLRHVQTRQKRPIQWGQYSLILFVALPVAPAFNHLFIPITNNNPSRVDFPVKIAAFEIHRKRVNRVAVR